MVRFISQHLFVVVLIVVKYEIINIRESIPIRHNLNINRGWRQIRRQTTRAIKYKNAYAYKNGTLPPAREG